MGFLKNITKGVGTLTKPFAKALDPILPEFAKKGLDKVDAITGNLMFGNAYGKPIESSSGASTPIAPVDTSGRLTQSEIDANLEQSKKMARLGKYFTSPLGALSTASTAGQKVFS